MIGLALAAVLAATPAPAQDPQDAAPVAEDAPASLEDIEVTGRPLSEMIRTFVNEVAAPNGRRGLARWNDRVCIGVANLQPAVGQYIADRVSQTAEDVGLAAGQPGCTPNVMIVVTDDADGLADSYVRESRRTFRVGGSGMDQGGAALRRFVSSDAPVRWWQVSMPVNSDTGERAVRIPGECATACSSVYHFAPTIVVHSVSRLNTQIVDHMLRTIVIVDIDQIGGVSGDQLSDYLAMVTLAQIDPEADTSRYASILNVFDAPESAPALTDWDRAYLAGLYGAERRRDHRAGRREVIDEIHRAHRRLRDARDEAPTDN